MHLKTFNKFNSSNPENMAENIVPPDANDSPDSDYDAEAAYRAYLRAVAPPISGISSCGDFGASSFAPRKLQTFKTFPKCRLSLKPHSELLPAYSNHSFHLRDCKMSQLGTRLGKSPSKLDCSRPKTFSPSHKLYHLYSTA